VSSEEKFMDDEEEERDKDNVFEENILSQVDLFQGPQHHESIPLFILGCNQQNLGNFCHTSSELSTG